MAMDLLERLRLRVTNSSDLSTDESPLLDDQFLYQNSHGNTQFEIFQPLPAYSTVLGICEDGLPLVLDLNDPNPGAILISGGRDTGKSQLLRSILSSACATNTVDQLYFYLITPSPGNQSDLNNYSQCYGILSSYDKATCELIVELAALVEQRKSGRLLGVKCILAIDNLYELIKHQDFDVINHLKWLYRFGASNGVWLISTLESERSNLIEPELLTEQKTRIISGSERWILTDSNSALPMKDHLRSYRTRIGNDWVDFWLPSSGY
jgi:hypothetical protein